MSDIERYEDAETPATVAPVTERELSVLMHQAEMLAQSNIIPGAYRRQPANILVAAMTGRTFGWDAITAMRNGHVIEGTWTIKPEAMLALVRRAGHSVTGEATPTGATVHGKRCDTGDEMTVEFTLADAERANLARKNTWRQYPQAMCWARAVSQLCRMLFADVTLGLSYTPEELGAEVDEDGSVIDVQERRVLPTPDDVERPISAANAAALRKRCEDAGLDVAAVVEMGTNGRTTEPQEVLIGEVGAVKEAMDRLASIEPPVETEEIDPEEAENEAALRTGNTEDVGYVEASS